MEVVESRPREGEARRARRSRDFPPKGREAERMVRPSVRIVAALSPSVLREDDEVGGKGRVEGGVGSVMLVRSRVFVRAEMDGAGVEGAHREPLEPL